MTQTINRMFASRAQALEAAHDLRTNRLDRYDDVHVVAREDAATADAIVALLMKALVLKAHAKVYAEGIERGAAMVTVHAPFGTAGAALDILHRHGPIDSGVPDTTDPAPQWDEATPVSCVLGMPVLLSDDATFARFWNVPALSKSSRTLSSALGMAELSRATDNFTGTFGLSLLSNKPTILSSTLGLPLLFKRRA